ncbi:YcjF family protein [Limimaricola hongkongensis]|uniref:GTP-binding protein n=1 Tax=Limimaricola hongkongensis DSM 17492 TaxID=1122180 RepID=A0A017HET8_9RHOB|nr:TIGR01620 family protein [Limimaricola hongkongensis]EYD72648.1 GTP-binding protein [Limimaricola hongkongensis DSM 17492]
MSDEKRRGPVMIDLEEQAPEVTPATAPPVPEPGLPQGAAMQRVAVMAARPRSKLARWFFAALGALVGFMLSVAAWDWVTGLLAANPVLGLVASVLLALVLGLLLAIAVKEAWAFRRLARLDHIQKDAAAALGAQDLGLAKSVSAQMVTLYAGRDELAPGLAQVEARTAEMFDADGVLGLAERALLAPLDAMALREVEAAARQVATVTAVVPLALADVTAALTSNLRMIRRVAEIYGGRSGTLGAWRLTRSVLTHLVATGAVAVGDDLVGSVAGGGVLSRVSRRFGEGVVNGALTARVGVAAIEVCRPLPFRSLPRPGVTGLVRRALTGLFGARDG